MSLSNKSENVQRLEGDAGLQITLPRVLGNLITNHDPFVLEKRIALIESKKFKGNTKELKEYKKLLNDLTPEQIQFCVGLLLGDTSLQASSTGHEFRLKTQQAASNVSLLEAQLFVLKPFVLSGPSKVKQRKIGNIYQELQTITHKAFTPLVEIFQNPNCKLEPFKSVDKIIPANIGNYLTPLTIGIWFCGDGGRRDYNKNQGLAIQFHTQGLVKNVVIH